MPTAAVMTVGSVSKFSHTSYHLSSGKRILFWIWQNHRGHVLAHTHTSILVISQFYQIHFLHNSRQSGCKSGCIFQMYFASAFLAKKLAFNNWETWIGSARAETLLSSAWPRMHCLLLEVKWNSLLCKTHTCHCILLTRGQIKTRDFLMREDSLISSAYMKEL